LAVVAPLSLLLLALAGSVRAGQIEVPVSGEFKPGAPSGLSAGAPVPIQMTVPSLTGALAPTLAASLVVQPALVQPAVVQAIHPVPALPKSVVATVKPAAAALAEKTLSAPANPSAEVADPGRALFDQGSEAKTESFESPRQVVRRGASRGEGWEVDGKPATRLSGGSFKEVLIHPSDPALVLKLFSEIGAKDAAGSLSEKRRELRNLEPLLAIGRAPAVVDQGALALRTPSTKGSMITGYVVQKRVFGREVGEMLRDPDPKVRARALAETRALFEDLIKARIKLEDAVKMGENLSIGREGRSGPVKAWVLDAGEAERVAERTMMDKLRSRPDPLRAYYERILAKLAQLL
jgi:hypothetical protein